MASFRETYPIDFDLYDKDTQNVLYIEETSDQTLTLEIENASTETIQLDDLTASTVSNSNYHFALRFRPGTLSSATLGSIQLATDTALSWEMATPETDASGMDVVYLKSTSAGLTMDPHTLQTLVFENVGADAGQGARGTRVELLYTSMTYSGGSAISGNREIHLSVINHRGKQNIPLHVGFVGDNGILNDGATPNALTLRFSNTLVYDAANPALSELSFSQNADETLRSKIILSFDVGTAAAEEWALGTDTEVMAISITQPTGWAIDVPAGGQSPEWILYPDTTDQVLYGINEPNGNPEYFDLGINNIISAFPTGHTHLHIQYENIPGYWDGQLKVAIEKRPLVYYDDINGSRNVGIGVEEPAEKLEVEGNIKTSGAVKADGTGDSYLLGNVGIGTNNPSATLDVNGNIYFGSNGEWQLDNNSWQDANIMYRGGSNNATNVKNFGLHGQSQRQVNLIVDGNVGIGTDSPSNPLHVRKSTTSNNNRLAYFESSDNAWADASIAIKGARSNSTGTVSFIDLDIHDNDETPDTFTMARIGAGKESISGINGQLRFFTNNNGTLNEAVRIDKNGKVGIGTNDPQATLDINGKVNVNGNVNVNGEKPIRYKTLTGNEDSIVLDTGYSYSIYIVSVVGFHSDTGGNDIHGVKLLPVENSGTWGIDVNLHGATADFWEVRILAIKRELVAED